MKTYIQPKIEIVEVEMHRLLAGSEIEGGGNTGQNLGDEFNFDDFNE